MRGIRTFNLVTVASTYAGSILAGYVLSLAGVPLPWMIGPMILAAIITGIWGRRPISRTTRPIGQVIISGTVGLSFTSAALDAVLKQRGGGYGQRNIAHDRGEPARSDGADASGATGCGHRLSRLHSGRPRRDGQLAERYGRPSAPVVFAQTARIVLIVLTVPPLLTLLDDSALQISRSGSLDTELFGASALLIGASLGGLLFEKLRVPNPYFLGALTFSAATTAAGLPLSPLPYPGSPQAKSFSASGSARRSTGHCSPAPEALWLPRS
jgi:hypothetical protein